MRKDKINLLKQAKRPKSKLISRLKRMTNRLKARRDKQSAQAI